MKITTKFEELMFFMTTRITISSSTSQGESIGTGFLVSVNMENEKSLTLLISNKHVFKNPKDTIVFTFNEELDENTPDYGNTRRVLQEDFSHVYTEHPNSNIDLACINVSILSHVNPKIFHRAIAENLISDFQEELLVPGIDVWFIGYPQNRFDTVNNLPLLRKGSIASLPKIDFNSQKQFVIDAQVFPGSSGSPVFAVINGHYKLVGVITSTMIRHGQLQAVPAVDSTTLGVEQIIGLGMVIKSTELKALIDLAIHNHKQSLEK